jgi:hypothetical protein
MSDVPDPPKIITPAREETNSQSNSPDELQSLEYSTLNARERRTKARIFACVDRHLRISVGPHAQTKTGIASFVAVIVQVPWITCLFYLTWLGILPRDKSAVTAVAGIVIVPLPTLCALGFGFASLWIAGISRRNILGTSGLILALGEIVWAIHWFLHG